MTSVPSTVPSKPSSFIASSRQIISSDAAMNKSRKSHGAQGPVCSMLVMKLATGDFNGRRVKQTVTGDAKL